MHPSCGQLTALLVSDAADVRNEIRGTWRFPGPADSLNTPDRRAVLTLRL